MVITGVDDVFGTKYAYPNKERSALSKKGNFDVADEEK
jgi:hypothetical protein